MNHFTNYCKTDSNFLLWYTYKMMVPRPKGMGMMSGTASPDSNFAIGICFVKTSILQFKVSNKVRGS